MATIKFKSFETMKDTVAKATLSPDRFEPNKFHIMKNGDTVSQASIILSSGRLTLIYVFEGNENMKPEDDTWFNDSIEVLDVGENVK